MSVQCVFRTASARTNAQSGRLDGVFGVACRIVVECGACPVRAAAPDMARTGVSQRGLAIPGLDIQLQDAHSKPQEMATAIKLLALLTVLTLAPAILIVMTSFTRSSSVVDVAPGQRHAGHTAGMRFAGLG